MAGEAERSAANPFGDDPAAPITDKDDYEIVGTNLVSVDSKAPRHVSSTTGTAYSSKSKGPVTGLSRQGKLNTC